MEKIQFRGHCQCCGKQYAVLETGRMSKHGYKVEHNSFEGTCSGENFKPIEHDKTEAENIIASLAKSVKELSKITKAYEEGTKNPTVIPVGYGKNQKLVNFSDTNKQDREEGLKRIIWNNKNSISMQKNFAQQLQRVVNEVHGKELKVISSQPLESIQIGEKRISGNNKILTCVKIQGVRIHWKDERNFTSWTGVARWRKLAKQ